VEIDRDGSIKVDLKWPEQRSCIH